MTKAIREAVAAAYARIGREGSRPPAGLAFPTGRELALRLGYPEDALERIPPVALEGFVGAAALPARVLAGGRDGGRVLDCGAGAGVDAFWLASRGRRVTALDASPEMLARLARALAHSPPLPAPIAPVLSLLPDLPFRDCVFESALLSGVANLVPDRERLLAELFRVLEPGGRLFVADVLALAELDEGLRADPDAWAFCVAGAMSVEDWRAALESAGFCRVEAELSETFPPLARGVLSAAKPGGCDAQ